MKSLSNAVLIFIIIFPIDILHSCCMVPVDYEGKISQNAQQAILFHQGDRQELILAIDYAITGETMPSSFAWIITVPAEPDAYHLADNSIFESVGHWAKHLVTPPIAEDAAAGGGCDCSAVPLAPASKAGSVELGRFAEVGPYAIQPVRAVGANALTGLNSWLQENGFPTESPEHMKYFIDNNFTFLCIKVSPPEGNPAVASGGDLSPLQISFKSDKVYYPLRFSSRQGMFDLQLTTLTREPVDFKQSREALTKISWLSRELYRNVPVKPGMFPGPLTEAYDRHQLGEVTGDWYLNLLQCRMVNQNNSIDTWKEDVFLVTNPKVEPRQASLWNPSLLWLIVIAIGVWALRRLLPFAFQPIGLKRKLAS
ncbi:MAG: hypothetical protein ACI9HK_001374 [Pirellulaceae bacterium]|jgi:hypothetical protein